MGRALALSEAFSVRLLMESLRQAPSYWGGDLGSEWLSNSLEIMLMAFVRTRGHHQLGPSEATCASYLLGSCY